MRLSVAMIVKDEAAQLATCLASMQDADELVVVDTGSTDDTIAIARSFGATVYAGPEFAWRDDFSFTRNQSLDRCTGEWVLIIDAKEWLDPGAIPAIRAAIAADAGQHETFYLWVQYEGTPARHRFPRVLRCRPGLRYQGAYHECPTIVENDQHDHPLDLTVWVGAGLSHAQDPARGVRILSRVVAAQPQATREVYYLAREYFYAGDYAQAERLFDDYLTRATWWPERLDAMLLLARCYWHTARGPAARTLMLEVVRENPDFAEALRFLAELHDEPWRHKWARLAAAATNEDVLFIR